MTPPVPAELVERMEKLVRQIATRWKDISTAHAVNEAEAIVAMLPEPVDPDLLLAREIAAAHNEPSYPDFALTILEGQDDDDIEVIIALAAIKRGRELERAGR